MANPVNYDNQQQHGFSDSDEEDTTLYFPYQEERNIGQCILTLFTWIILGLIFCLPGPNLLAISCNLCSDLDNMGALFVARGFGALVGALVGRSLIYRSKRYGVLLLGLLTLAVSIPVFPVLKSLSTAATVMFIMGLAFGAVTQGYVIMDESSGLNVQDGLNKQILGFSLGAAAAPLVALPFLDIVMQSQVHNRTAHGSGRLINGSEIYLAAARMDKTCEIFPSRICFSTNHFAKSFWLSTIPCFILLFALIVMMTRKSRQLIVKSPDNVIDARRPADFKVYALRFVAFGVMFFYQGNFIIAAITLFAYVMLGPFELATTKAVILISLLWVSFSFGLLMLQLLFKKVTKPEKRLGTALFKSSLCFITAILLMKIEDRDGQTLTLLVYMFFIANTNATVQDVVVAQSVLSKQLRNTMQIIAAAMAEALFPYFGLTLMFHKGWHAMTFAILFASLMLFLSCTILALCPATINRASFSVGYQDLKETVEDGSGREIHKQIKSLLGGYTDQDSTLEASEDEVLFDKKRQKIYKTNNIK